uniref:COesterase domain-containing protein n=1 Tax=Panagrellus redivivus TaxID=6233 RepID=A0A7E4V895_PANRE
MYKLTLCILFCCIWISIAQNFEKSRSVWVEQGLVRGKIYKIGGQQIQIFRGVPYAEPPIGDLRFKKPVKKARWEREYTATEYGPPCLQFMDFHRYDNFSGHNMLKESENCLFLNIFSPYDSEDEAHLHPIVVWIHGGSFLAGSADTGINMEVVAKNFVFKGVTLITVNYRLGPLGFMSINYGNRIEANFGIWDIKLALEWIQRNIKQFNGDPSKVTIMGESAGAAAVSVLAVSPLTKGLVHQAIAMSGSATAGWAIHRHGLSSWDMGNVAEYLTCKKEISDEDSAQILNRESLAERVKVREACNLQDNVPSCLTADELTTEKMVECFRKEVNFSQPVFRRALAVELGVSKMVVDNELIPASGPELINKYARVPLMTGVARREWAHKKPEFYQFVKFENLTKAQCEDSVRKIIENAYVARLPYKVQNATIDLIANTTYLRYIDDVNINYEMPEIVQRLQNLEADIEFVSPCQREIEAYVANDIDVFAYSFDYMPRGPLIEEEHWYYTLFGDTPVALKRKANGLARHGPFHGLDHAFIFTEGYSSNFQIDPFTKRDKLMSKMLTKMIVNFAANGNPSLDHFKWEPFTNESSGYASLDLPPRFIRGDVHFPAPNFWNKEIEMLSRYVPASEDTVEQIETALSTEERIQLNAYRRAWYALWILVISLGFLIWLALICVVFHRCERTMAKPYDNIVINR